MKARVPLLALALVLAPLGCGGDDEDGDEAARTAPPTPTAAEPPPPATGEPTATTGEPPGARRGPPRRGSRRYTCRGEELLTLPPEGPVRVEPPVVRPGERFTVRLTEPDARDLLVSLAGVSDVPISASSTGSRPEVELRMPANASCGNKLLTIEGDVSAQASIAVAR